MLCQTSQKKSKANQKMHLNHITCSDPREHNTIESMMELAALSKAEIAVQCHPSAMSDGMPRNIWFGKLLREAKNVNFVNLAIHINAQWAIYIATMGEMPEILAEWLSLRRNDNTPVIQRVQLNLPTEKLQFSFSNAGYIVNNIANVINDFPYQEFILQYKDNISKEIVSKLDDNGIYFNILFDESGGNGISPKKWKKPVLKNRLTGYSGGFSPDNVIQNLDTINRVVPKKTDIWIDAEWKLKSYKYSPTKALFDVDLARKYINRANIWQK